MDVLLKIFAAMVLRSMDNGNGLTTQIAFLILAEVESKPFPKW